PHLEPRETLRRPARAAWQSSSNCRPRHTAEQQRSPIATRSPASRYAHSTDDSRTPPSCPAQTRWTPSLFHSITFAKTKATPQRRKGAKTQRKNPDLAFLCVFAPLR